MYWLSEVVSYSNPHEEELIRYKSSVVYRAGLKFFWIPFFYGNRAFHWKQLGFDAAVLQPNHFFNDTREERIQDTAELAITYGMGVEIECDERMNWMYQFIKGTYEKQSEAELQASDSSNL
ncbi:DUF4855 domain-containing protein [Paenibacillus sp. KQZ6P-2]|uniref:DUF4855 domain-containing protein n=2 Tax=Paenibacillus mangrovi TaxID=2931978 RepID=A0A9X2B6T1_9BACL|nr:DUF4855 domain-containing protein [Paenibacillus mangrovi]